MMSSARCPIAILYLPIAYADVNLAQQVLVAGDIAQAIDLLDNHIPTKDDEDLRGFEWYYLWSLTQTSSTVIAWSKPAKSPVVREIRAARVSPDGEMLAVAGGSSNSGEVSRAMPSDSIVPEPPLASRPGMTISSYAFLGFTRENSGASVQAEDAYARMREVCRRLLEHLPLIPQYVSHELSYVNDTLAGIVKTGGRGFERCQYPGVAKRHGVVGRDAT